jgi:Thiol-disulfide isomerase and thioredoxins
MVAAFVFCSVLSASIPFSAGKTIPADTHASTIESKNVRHLERLNESKLKKLIQSRKGKALFINVWATWCEPCVEEFPDIVKLSDEMKGQKIEFVGVSGDDCDDELSKVIPFIAKEKAQFKFYIAKIEAEDAFIDAFNKRWGGGIPATFIYDAKGNMKAFLVGKQSYQNLKVAIEKALRD